MLNNWLKIFIYHFKNNKLFSLLNILGLSIGIAGVIFSILYRNHEMQYDAWNPYKKEIIRVYNDMGKMGVWNTSPAPLAPIALQTIPEIGSFSYFQPTYATNILEYQNKKIVLNEAFDADANIFEIFPFEFIEGDPKTALRDKNSIVFSEQSAKEIFGNEKNLIGKIVTFNKRDWVVKGIYRIPDKSSVMPQIIFNGILAGLEQNKDKWGNFSYALVFKLKKNADLGEVKKKIESIYFEYSSKSSAKAEGISIEEYIDKYGKIEILLEPLETAYLQGTKGGYPEDKGNQQLLIIISGISILILVLSLVNYINLATANAIRRAKEVGIRKIVGANKIQIIKQFVFETSLMAFVAILLSLAIVELCLPYYNEFISRNLTMEGRLFFSQLLLIFVAVVFLAGVFPAFYIANFKVQKVLKGDFSRSKNGIWLRNGMLILQFTIATLFVIGSYVVYQQVTFMTTKDLGFHGEQVLEIPYKHPRSGNLYNRYETVKNELSKIEGVQKVSSGAFRFGSGASSATNFDYGNKSITGLNLNVDYEMLDMLKIRIIEGRNLSKNLASDTLTTMLANKKFVEELKIDDPIGKIITTGWEGRSSDKNLKLEIVGIVDDFNLYGFQSEIPAMAFIHFKTVDWMIYNMNELYIEISPDNMEKTISNIEKFWTINVDQEYPFSYEFVDKVFAKTYREYVKQKNLFFVLNLIVIAIALFGLFALASYSIQRRMKEIAIRKTLGAETKTLLKNLSKQYVLFCVIGFLIAVFPTYLLLEKWLGNFAFRIDVSWLPFLIGFIALMTLTLIIVLSRAYQATKVDVLKYLKYE